MLITYDPDQNHVISAMLSTLPSTIKAKQTKLALWKHDQKLIDRVPSLDFLQQFCIIDQLFFRLNFLTIIGFISRIFPF